MDKRGISNIIATLLIVLLVIVVTAIFWVVVRNFVQESSEDISLTQFTTSVDIKSAAIEGGNMEVRVKRSVGKGTYLGTKFIFSDGKNSVVLEDRNNPLDELEERTFSFTPAQLTAAGIDILDITEVSVAPIIETEAGKEAIGQVTDTRKVGTGSGGGPITGGVCGDSLVQTPNGENPPFDEECDLETIPLTCDTLDPPFVGGGTLRCLAPGDANECMFDTSLCLDVGACSTEGAFQDCPLQDGVCFEVQQQCVGGFWEACDYGPSYEEVESFCVDGLDNDCNGLFDNEEDVCELLFTSTVEDPWPSLTKLFFIVADITPDFIDLDHGGRYIKFVGNEERCIQIFDYITPQESVIEFDKSIVKLDESLIPFSINVGDSFTIYEKSLTCGV